MGYECPVCGDPQADETHLANHLAFTAIARGGEHEAWLDERIPDWDQHDDESLAAEVTEYAAETEYPQVFDDTTDRTGREHRRHEHDNTSRGRSDLPPGADALTDVSLDEDAQEALSRAREMTRKRRANTDEDASE
jgi:hypothetical protein